MFEDSYCCELEAVIFFVYYRTALKSYVTVYLSFFTIFKPSLLQKKTEDRANTLVLLPDETPVMRSELVNAHVSGQQTVRQGDWTKLFARC